MEYVVVVAVGGCLLVRGGRGGVDRQPYLPTYFRGNESLDPGERMDVQ